MYITSHRQWFQSACGDAPSDAFLAGAIQNAARSGRFSVEAGTRAAAPFPAPLSPLAVSFLRCAPDRFPDRFHLTKPNTFQHNREASVARGPMVFTIIPECRSASFGTGVPIRRHPQSSRRSRCSLSCRSQWSSSSSWSRGCKTSVIPLPGVPVRIRHVTHHVVKAAEFPYEPMSHNN